MTFVIVLNFFLLYVLKSKSTMLKVQNPRFKSFNEKYDTLWADVKLSGKLGISLYYIFFTFRRII